MREKLAEFAHKQWSGWMEYLFSKCSVNNDGTATIPKWAVDRLTRQINTNYENLDEQEKESDRNEADGMIDVIMANKKMNSGWINVKNNHFPTPRVEILCKLPNGKRRIGYYVDGKGKGEFNIGFFGLDSMRIYPVEWMYLP